MKTEDQVLTLGLRESLKAIMLNEIESLPEILEALEPKDRMNVICKLMPYVFPKLESVHPSSGEPFSINGF